MIGLVSCSATKLDRAAPAAELYVSPLFRLSLAYARARCAEVYVLSARWGLLELDDVVDPYNVRIGDLDALQLGSWASSVAADLDGRHVRHDRILILAGAGYVDPLRPLLRRQGRTLVEPLAGLQIGERLSFLSRAEAALDRAEAALARAEQPRRPVTKCDVVAALVELEGRKP